MLDKVNEAEKIEKQRPEDLPREPIIVPPKKYNKGWENIEVSNRQREVERDRRELGLNPRHQESAP